MDYCDVVHGQLENDSFINKIVQIRYNAALAIKGAIKCTSRSKLYKELGLESLKSRRRRRPLFALQKIISNAFLTYL